RRRRGLFRRPQPLLRRGRRDDPSCRRRPPERAAFAGQRRDPRPPGLAHLADGVGRPPPAGVILSHSEPTCTSSVAALPTVRPLTSGMFLKVRTITSKPTLTCS